MKDTIVSIRGMIYRYLPAFFLSLLIFSLSSIPSARLINDRFTDILVRKVAHIVIYACLTLSYVWTIYGPGIDRLPSYKSVIKKLSRIPLKFFFMGALFSLLYAISDEYHQTFVHGRNGQLFDVFIDIIGIALAIVLLKGRILKKPAG